MSEGSLAKDLRPAYARKCLATWFCPADSRNAGFQLSTGVSASSRSASGTFNVAHVSSRGGGGGVTQDWL